SRAGPSAAFLWVPFLSPPKEMEQNKYAISPVRSDLQSDRNEYQHFQCGKKIAFSSLETD
ncbi:MAG: hypothetical protein IKK40_03205, partial [Bacteroidales bacterium]|nr:hypothetical protein [Bacteroidales bacterium]